MGIDLDDSVLHVRPDGKSARHYRLFCDNCGAARGYGAKGRANTWCVACVQLKRITERITEEELVFVDLTDRIYDADSSRYHYKMWCPTCGKDKGYLLLSLIGKDCWSCGVTKRANTTRSLPRYLNVDYSDYITAPDGKRLYTTVCVRCGAARGYQPLVKAEYLCTACGYAALREEYLEDLAKRVSSNVDVYDNIRCVSEGGISYYLYEMTCPQCGASRGKQPLDRQDCVCNACYAKSKGSKGERSISNWLDARGIEFGREIQRDGLKFEHPLFFDFHLTEFDVYIEYDGVQHFEPVAHFGGEEGFRQTKARDAIKDQYCKDNNIRLIRISYKDYDRIEEILTEELTKLGVLTAKAS